MLFLKELMILLTYLNFTLGNFTSWYELGIILRKGYVNKLGVNLARRFARKL